MWRRQRKFLGCHGCIPCSCLKNELLPSLATLFPSIAIPSRLLRESLARPINFQRICCSAILTLPDPVQMLEPLDY
ncbi:hypothetical protein GOP47_0025797 [Adiantum capillus-veneris]|uniref:Uncharacterized protein n=1 Tax=Adiantum capillus-veneris TaxID=13818 RepID=A0A9D4U1W5_ADICA|nr:hypothetical protein GOP47_0025797 [Adiantum capillus-veneris]